MNPAEDQHNLATHQSRVGRVNRIQWRFETPEIDVMIDDAPCTIGERTRHRLGAMLIRAGERLLPLSPDVRAADCEPC